MGMRVLIATVKIPFVRGGAEIHAEGLRKAMCAEGHKAEIVAIPFKWYPPERILDQILACRLLDLTESAGVRVDRIIALKFPAYFIPHPNKVLWILHQHRPAYDLWGRSGGDLSHYPNGVQIRDAIQRADRHFIPEAKGIFANSRNVSHRLRKYCDIGSTPLYHPPQHAERFYSRAAEDYFFFPSRLQPLKRQALVLEALSLTRQPVRVRFAGVTDERTYGEELQVLARMLKVDRQVEWLGTVSEEEKRALYACALGVIFPPLDEDYGYVTLEAMLAAKPIITCTDSGGPLEFVRGGETGLVTEPTPAALAAIMDDLWADRRLAKLLGEAGCEHYHRLGISWSNVVRRLLS
jgi:glycosyltransferase involved in cell wall biosynthesis